MDKDLSCEPNKLDGNVILMQSLIFEALQHIHLRRKSVRRRNLQLSHVCKSANAGWKPLDFTIFSSLAQQKKCL